jgi:hypothetical protein
VLQLPDNSKMVYMGSTQGQHDFLQLLKTLDDHHGESTESVLHDKHLSSIGNDMLLLQLLGHPRRICMSTTRLSPIKAPGLCMPKINDGNPNERDWYPGLSTLHLPGEMMVAYRACSYC